MSTTAKRLLSHSSLIATKHCAKADVPYPKLRKIVIAVATKHALPKEKQKQHKTITGNKQLWLLAPRCWNTALKADNGLLFIG